MIALGLRTWPLTAGAPIGAVMVVRVRWDVYAGGVLLAFMSVGCGSIGGSGRPQPFPTAPVPSAVGRPATPRLSAPDLAFVVQTALDLRGTPYRQGGADPAEGFDCSGFVVYVFGLHHLDVPRTVTEQYQRGRPIRRNDVRAGDLVFFSMTGRGASHVGIALGSAGMDEFVHAPSSSGVVRVEHLSAPYWHGRFVGARRIF